MTTIRADAASAWRDRARYDRLLGFDKATWAWECLRRSLGREPAVRYNVDWKMLRADPPLCVLTLSGAICRHGVMPLCALDVPAALAGHVF